MAEYRALGEAVATLLCTSFPTTAERLAAAALDDSDLPAAAAAAASVPAPVPTKAPEVQRTPSPAPSPSPATAPSPPPAAAPVAAATKVPDDTKAQLARVRRARLVSHGLTTFASPLGRWETLGSLG